MRVRSVVKTSYFISNELLTELEDAHIRTGVSKEKLSKRCLLRYLRMLNNHYLEKDNVIGYQTRGIGYNRLNFRWTAAEYVFLQQVRYHLRLSISFLVCKAIKRYLSRIVRAIIALKRMKKDWNHLFNKLLERFKKFQIYWANFRKDFILNKHGTSTFFRYNFDFYHY